MRLAILGLGNRLRDGTSFVIWEYDAPRVRRTIVQGVEIDSIEKFDTCGCWTCDPVHSGLCNNGN